MARIAKLNMDQALDNNTLAVILYFVSRLDGVLGKTHLQKLLFLSDLLATKKLKEPVTALEFKRYKHGPFAATVGVYTEKLIQSGLIEAREFPLRLEPKQTYTRYYLKKPVPIKEKLLALIGAEKLLVVDEVADSYGNISLQSLLDIVYSLPEVKGAKMDELFNLAKKSKDVKGEEEDLPF